MFYVRNVKREFFDMLQAKLSCFENVINKNTATWRQERIKPISFVSPNRTQMYSCSVFELIFLLQNI